MYSNNIILIFLIHIFNLKEDNQCDFYKLIEKSGCIKKYLSKNRKISIFVEYLFAIFWPGIYFIYINYYFVRYIIEYIFHKKNKFTEDSLFLCLEPNIVDRAKKANLYQENLYWFNRPSKKISSKINEKNVVTINDFIGVGDICRSFLNSFLVFYTIGKKFTYYKTLYALQFFEYNLVWNALNMVAKETKLYTGTQRDRWVILVDKLPHRHKVMLQHGIEDPINDKLKFRINNFTEIYAFNKTEAYNLLETCFKSRPLIHYFSLGLKLEKISDPQKSILIIGHWKTELQNELYIIEHLQKSKYQIFLKNHPTLDQSIYYKYQNKYNFILVENHIYPDINYIISYDSTLALEYEIAGKHVYKYNKFNNLDEIINLFIF